MSYIVVYQREDGSSGVEECADLDLAVVTAERLRNVDAVERPRIFKTEEITYDFKPYYRVEVTTAAAANGAAGVTPPPAPPAPPAPVAEPAASDEVEEAPSMENVVEKKMAEKKAAAAAAEADTEVSEADADAAPVGGDGDNADSRGGLFGETTDAADKAAEAVEDATDEGSTPPRRGLFGR